VQHITIGYLRGYEELTEKNKNGLESLFYKMLHLVGEKTVGRWLEVASFLWAISPKSRQIDDAPNSMKVDIVERIIAFWKWTGKEKDKIKDKLGEKYEDFVSKLGLLTIYLKEIDGETAGLIINSAEWIEKGYNATLLFEYLADFQKDESVKYLGKIMLKILANATPTFREENVISIVEHVYGLAKKTLDSKLKKELKDEADEICNTYGRRGIHFLKDLWKENNDNGAL
jgi:hypothetical protein